MKKNKFIILKCVSSTRIGRQIFGDICQNVYHINYLPSYKKSFEQEDYDELTSRDMKVLDKEGSPNYGTFIVKFTNGKFVKFGASEWFHMIPVKEEQLTEISV